MKHYSVNKPKTIRLVNVWFTWKSIYKIKPHVFRICFFFFYLILRLQHGQRKLCFNVLDVFSIFSEISINFVERFFLFFFCFYKQNCQGLTFVLTLRFLKKNSQRGIERNIYITYVSFHFYNFAFFIILYFLLFIRFSFFPSFLSL